MSSGENRQVPPAPPEVADNALASKLRAALLDLTFDDVKAVETFDRQAFEDANNRGSSVEESLENAAMIAFSEARNWGQLRHPGPQGEECLTPLEETLTPVGCDDILFEKWPDLESSGLEIFDMMAELNPFLAARDVVLMAINTGYDDHEFLAARLSAVQRHCDAEGMIAGSRIQLMRPEVYW